MSMCMGTLANKFLAKIEGLLATDWANSNQHAPSPDLLNWCICWALIIDSGHSVESFWRNMVKWDAASRRTQIWKSPASISGFLVPGRDTIWSVWFHLAFQNQSKSGSAEQPIRGTRHCPSIISKPPQALFEKSVSGFEFQGLHPDFEGNWLPWSEASENTGRELLYNQNCHFLVAPSILRLGSGNKVS